MDLQPINQVLTTVLSIVAIIGIPLGVYKFYTKDQKEDGVKMSDTNTELKLMRTEMTLKIQGLTDAILLIKSNDLHSIFEKQRDQDDQINKLTNAVTSLTTIIDERVPRKTVDKVT